MRASFLHSFIHSVHTHALPPALIPRFATHEGLGKATAELLVEVGYHVILTARNEAEVSSSGGGGGGGESSLPLLYTQANPLSKFHIHTH